MRTGNCRSHALGVRVVHGDDLHLPAGVRPPEISTIELSVTNRTTRLKTVTTCYTIEGPPYRDSGLVQYLFFDIRFAIRQHISSSNVVFTITLVAITAWMLLRLYTKRRGAILVAIIQ
jgi:hypothetical protein